MARLLTAAQGPFIVLAIGVGDVDRFVETAAWIAPVQHITPFGGAAIAFVLFMADGVIPQRDRKGSQDATLGDQLKLALGFLNNDQVRLRGGSCRRQGRQQEQEQHKSQKSDKLD